MAIKKSDLYSSLWASCDELRGGMDASQYKDYVEWHCRSGFVRGRRAAGGRTRGSMCCGGSIVKISRAERGIGLGDETGLAYLPPLMRPFLDASGRLDQGGSHVFYTGGPRRG